MADKFSAAWWNEQAQAAGGLTKAAVESLTGQSFPVVWNPDGTIDWDKAWPKNAQIGAPGLGTSGLLLSGSPMPASYPYQTAEAAFAAKDPNWGGWNRLVSPVGVVAPNATAPWQPELSTSYTPPAPAPSPVPADNPVTQGGGAVPVTTLAPAPTGITGSGGTVSKPATNQTFTGGEVQPGGGGEVSGSAGVMGDVKQRAAPGSQYSDGDTPAPGAASVAGLASGALIFGLVILGLIIFAVVAKRRAS